MKVLRIIWKGMVADYKYGGRGLSYSFVAGYFAGRREITRQIEEKL